MPTGMMTAADTVLSEKDSLPCRPRNGLVPVFIQSLCPCLSESTPSSLASPASTPAPASSEWASIHLESQDKNLGVTWSPLLPSSPKSNPSALSPESTLTASASHPLRHHSLTTAHGLTSVAAVWAPPSG